MHLMQQKEEVIIYEWIALTAARDGNFLADERAVH